MCGSKIFLISGAQHVGLLIFLMGDGRVKLGLNSRSSILIPC